MGTSSLTRTAVRTLTPLALLIALFGSAAAAAENDRVAAVRTYLQSQGDEVLFGLREEVKESGVRFSFIEGDRAHKADHVRPLRITVTVMHGRKGKLTPPISVKAVREGLVVHHRDRAAKKRWADRINDHLGADREG